MIKEGLGGCSRESGFDRLTVRNLERPKISLRDTGFDRLAPRLNLKAGCGNGKQNGKRDSKDRSSGRGIVVFLILLNARSYVSTFSLACHLQW